MSRQIQIRRGTKNQHASFTGAIGEVTMDTTNNTLRVHDGKTVGGNEMLSRQVLYSNMTNCLTEIPQDIKLELTGGTLTLKAGSTVYVPNGVGRFDVIDIKSDISATYTSNRQCFLYYYNGGLNVTDAVSNCVSGDTDTLAGQQWHVWYDTANNVIKRYTSDATTPAYTGMSLPLAVITISSSGTSIDQVFNGFGYIGSTVFVLPGVKGLIPNGRNEDGTLKNDVLNCASVQARTFSGTETIGLILNSSGSLSWRSLSGITYDAIKNELINIADGTKLYNVVAGSFDVTNNKITRLEPINTFHAVDYNDTEYMAHQSMPSDRYINLTLGVSGSSYTMPSDGWLNLVKVSGGVEYISAEGRLQQIAFSSGSGQVMSVCMPVSQGEKVIIYYNVSGATQKFRFVYANGAK